MNDISFDNTNISFTPSFLGQGWETSLLPKIERGHLSHPDYMITFDYLKQLFLKIWNNKRWEVKIWTTAIARLFL